MMFVVKLHTLGKNILSICDKDILGKTFEEGRKILNLADPFYQGEEKTQEEVMSMLQSGYILHLTGMQSVKLALDLNLVDPDHILTVQGVPHAEVLFIEE